MNHSLSSSCKLFFLVCTISFLISCWNRPAVSSSIGASCPIYPAIIAVTSSMESEFCFCSASASRVAWNMETVTASSDVLRCQSAWPLSFWFWSVSSLKIEMGGKPFRAFPPWLPFSKDGRGCQQRRIYAPFILTVDWLGWLCYLSINCTEILNYSGTYK